MKWLHDPIVYARAMNAKVHHYHDMAGLEIDAIVQKRNGDWLPVKVKLGAGGVEKACASLVRVERKITAAGGKAPVAKLVVVGFGELAHATDNGMQVVPVDMLGA